MALYRDSLRSDLHKMSKQATILGQTSIEDRRRKLEGRLNCFHQKAKEFIGEKTEDILPQFTGWESDDDDKLSEVWKEDEKDEEESSESSENAAICMPSSLRPEDIQKLELEILASQELELHKGQASDCLLGLCMALGHKAVLYRTKVRTAKTSTDKTRTWDDIKAITIKVNKTSKGLQTCKKSFGKPWCRQGHSYTVSRASNKRLETKWRHYRRKQGWSKE